MIRDFNLLATTYRGNEKAACSELHYLLDQVGDPTPRIVKTGVSGLIAARSTLDPLNVVRQLRAVLGQRPFEFRYTLRIIPIERVVRTDLDEIADAAVVLSSKIAENETFRVTVEKRFTKISSNDVIEAVAARIKRRVDLGTPAMILLVEIVGGLTGVSVVTPEDVLSVIKEKML